MDCSGYSWIWHLECLPALRGLGVRVGSVWCLDAWMGGRVVVVSVNEFLEWAIRSCETLVFDSFLTVGMLDGKKSF